ncbi:HNH endonuclease [Bradyrhizobium liaoningense]
MTGLIFGKLTVLRADGRRKDGHVSWLCQCTCGKQKSVSSNSLRRKNPVRSCGCLNHTRAQNKRQPGGAWNEGKSYAIGNGEHCYKTRHAWAKAAVRHYGNKCERCEWDAARCDVHHRKPKAKGGLHTIANAVVLCPNCHRIEHEATR